MAQDRLIFCKACGKFVDKGDDGLPAKHILWRKRPKRYEHLTLYCGSSEPIHTMTRLTRGKRDNGPSRQPTPVQYQVPYFNKLQA